MQSLFTVALVSTFIISILAQQMTDDVQAEKRMRSFAFAKRSPYRQFAFAKRSDDDVEGENEEMEKRARFAFAKRSPYYRQFAFAKRASPYGFAFAKRGYSSFA
ncbi:unnamed protein product [Nippostrongylus brasiliensis]|uniref:CRE-FLP-11 protein n=1 Tax=Nippostrongylus brasiliensis TaxID=27835 RepID=A0A0N4YA64_NIPBR|nr:hypothetical protein Q1695_011023 [Nippostrongylus brasiliensis]VDL76846.1 unnamed protein product [Nippostrongylus brasiliensis]